MLEAIQKNLNNQMSDISSELQKLPLSEYSDKAKMANQAQQHIDKAIESMKQLEEKIADSRFESSISPENETQMNELTDSAISQLNEAGQVIKQSLSASNQQNAADQAQAMADELMQKADSFDESVSPEDQQQLLAQLEQAKKILEKNLPPQLATVSGGGGPAGSLVYTQSGNLSIQESLRILAEQFYSYSIHSRQRQVKPIEDEPSDVEYYELENEFFENTANYTP
jgi:hypothetical protein